MVMHQQSFPRRIDALGAIAAFTEAALAGVVLSAAHRHGVDFAIEELFTNMVKYSPEGAPEIWIQIRGSVDGAQVCLIDTDVDVFDPTLAPDAGVLAPLEQRQPGGLGIHLVRRVVQDLHYTYSPAQRESRTCFSVGAGGSPPTCCDRPQPC